MNRKWLFVLPNLFTVSSIFCGIYAITLAAGAEGAGASHDFFRAAMAILFGMFFDGCDGRVARLTKTESDFGVQLDSLADVITFGAAPAVLLYEWALWPLGIGGVLLAGVFATCGALRLARFNVMSAQEDGPSEFFVGLPIPLAAGMVVSLVIASVGGEARLVSAYGVALVTLVLSYLMVSNVRYHSFKRMRLQGRELMVLLLVLAAGAFVALRLRPGLVLVSYFSGYVLFGLVEEVLFRRRRDLTPAAPSSALAVDDQTVVDDEPSL